MVEVSFLNYAWIETFIYILLRFSGMVIISPIFGRKNLPVMFRIGMCLVFSVIVIALLPQNYYIESSNLISFFINALKETVFGLLIGYISLVTLSLAISSGRIIDMQIGFGLSNFFDPQFGSQIPVTGSLLNIVLILVFFMVDGHHMLIKIITESFIMVPPGKAALNTAGFELLISYFIWFFLISVKVVIPIVAVSLVSEFALGVIVKTMPQMNVFVVGIPIRIFLGLLIIMFFLPVFIMLLNGVFDQMFDWNQKIIQGLIAK